MYGLLSWYEQLTVCPHWTQIQQGKKIKLPCVMDYINNSVPWMGYAIINSLAPGRS